MADAKKEKRAFDPSKVTRNKCLAWDLKGNGGKGAGVYTGDVLNDDGTVNTAEAAKWGLTPEQCVYLTVADLHPAYQKDAASALKHAVAEGNWRSADDLVHSLIIADAMQDAANESVRAKRPVTDKSKERATNVMLAMLKAQGMSEEEARKRLAALTGV